MSDQGGRVPFEDMELAAIGAHALAMIEAATKNKERSQGQFVAAGLYLAEAKRRVCAAPHGPTWPNWLAEHCHIKISRANQLIRLADGRTSVSRERAKNAARNRALRQRNRPSTSRDVRPHCEAPDEHTRLVAEVTRLIPSLSTPRLRVLKADLENQHDNICSK